MLLKLAALLTLGTPGPVADPLDDYVRAQMRWQQIPGLSLTVIQNGQVVRSRGYGFSNLEIPAKATPDTVYKIGSVSKILVASAVMFLVRQGRLNLDASVRDYITEAPESWREVRLRHLLSHTAGLVREIPGFDPYKRQTLTEQLSAVFPTPLRFAPGVKWEYSNVGYFVLAEVISRESGQDWESFIRARLLEPSGMKQTLVASPALVLNRAQGYETRAGRLQNAENWLAVRPSGAYLSTVVDFARLDRMLDLLSPEVQRTMWTPTKLNDGKATPYGLGWFVNRVGDHRHVYHGGGVPGFVAEYHRFPDDGLSVVVMANIGNRDLSDLAMHVANHYLPGLLPQPEPAITDPDPAVTKKLGSLLGDMTRDRFEASLFTSQAADFLRQDLALGFGKRLKEFGPLQRADVLERRAENGRTTLRYRFTYRHITLFGSFTMTPQGQIERWMLTD